MGHPVFVREATGLVKTLGFTDQVLLAISCVNPIYAFVFAPLYAPFFFPGAYLPVVYALGFVQAFAILVVYNILNRAMPRSGGDYVWTTRILGPFAGIVQLVFAYGGVMLSIATFSVSSVVTLGFVALLFGSGVSTQNSGLIAASSAISQVSIGYPISIAIIAFIIAILLLGLRAFVWFQRLSFVLYFLAIALFIVVPLSINPSTFPATFDSAMRFAGSNITYNGVIQEAVSGGFPTSGFDLNNTLLASMPWGFWTYAGYQWGTNLAGETKHPESSLYRSMLTSLTIAFVLFVAVAVITYNAFGFTFLNAASYVYATNPSAFPTLPSVSMFMSLGNPFVAVLTGLGVAVGFVLVVAGNMIAASRQLFAAAFDRVLPTKFADVNERFHSPHMAILLIGVIYVILATIFWYAGFAMYYLNTSLVVPIGIAIPLVSGLVFYFKKPDLYKRAVGAATKPTALIIAALVGIGSCVVFFLALIFPITSGIYLGAGITIALEVVVAFLALSILMYASAKLRIRRSGLDFDKAYAEIPPE